MNYLLIVVSLWANLSFPQLVANKCKGEASFALSGCACVVKNRLAQGWKERNVLSAFYARNVWATPKEVALVTDVLDGKTPCDSRYYFMFGYGDVLALGLTKTPPIAKVVRGSQQIWFYEYWYKRRKQ